MYSQFHRNFDKSSLSAPHKTNHQQKRVLGVLTASVHLIHLDCADLTEADIDQGEAELLEAVHCPEHHGGRGHAEMMMMMCHRSRPTMFLSFSHLPSPSQ